MGRKAFDRIYTNGRISREFHPAKQLCRPADLDSRGFVYVRESEELMDEAKGLLTDTLANCSASELREWNSLKGKLRDALSDYIYQKTKRSPMILPIIMET